MHGKRECVFCKNTENLIPLGNRMGYICTNCRTLWNTEDGDFLEHGNPSIGHIADYALGHMTENLFMVGNVCVPDLFITGEGEVRYGYLQDAFREMTERLEPDRGDDGAYAQPLEEAMDQVDALLRWSMMEGINLGIKLGRDPAAIKVIEEAGEKD